VRLTFLGTRGCIDARTPRHRMHTALLVTHRGGRVMVDCGKDWADRTGRLRAQAILITHAHPDHAGGLREGSPCPVYTTRDAWKGMARLAIARRHRHVVGCWHRRTISGIGFEAFAVVHSVRAPAVGYRISAGGVSVFYVPDVLAIPERADTARWRAPLYRRRCEHRASDRAAPGRRRGLPAPRSSLSGAQSVEQEQ
jgi:phosphoribosyl 1,2-cyclic phosphodiesterase